MLGEGVNRVVANVRASRGHAVLRHGGREAVLLEDVAPGDRTPILRRYLQLAPRARPHIPADPQAPLADFDRVGLEHPVVRVQPESPPAREAVPNARP
jgi:hypothetical protein